MFSESRKFAVAIPLFMSFALIGCGEDDEPNPQPTPTRTPSPQPTPTPTPTSTVPTEQTISFDFRNGAGGWLADYVDYQNGQEESIRFASGIESLPREVGGGTGFRLSSVNRPDDVFMHIIRPVTRLIPGQAYRITTSVTFATNKPSGCIGAGGDPGGSVYVKAGASAEIPGKVLDDIETLRPNYDLGQQAESGADLKVIGDYAQPSAGGSCGNDGPYQLKTLDSGRNSPVVRADEAGRLWLLIGTDSGYEGLTTIYYRDGRVTLTPVS